MEEDEEEEKLDAEAEGREAAERVKGGESKDRVSGIEEEEKEDE